MFNSNPYLLKSNQVLNNGIVLKSCFVKLSKRCDVEAFKNNSKPALDSKERCSVESDSSIEVICSVDNSSNKISRDCLADKSTNDGTGSLFTWHNSSDTDVDEDNETHPLTYFADKFKHDIADCDYKSGLLDSDVRKGLSSNATTSTVSISDVLDDGNKLKVAALNMKNYLESSAYSQLKHNQSKMQCSVKETNYNLKHCTIVLKRISTKCINKEGKITKMHRGKVTHRSSIKPLYINSNENYNSTSESFKSVSTLVESDFEDNINYSDLKSKVRKNSISSIKNLKSSPRKLKYTKRNHEQQKRNSNDTTLRVSKIHRKHSESSSDSERSCDSRTPKKHNKKSKVISDSEDYSDNENLKHHGTKSRMRSDRKYFAESFNSKHHRRKPKSISDGKGSSENLNLKRRQRKHSESSLDSESSCDLRTPKKCNKKSKVISDSEDYSKNENLKHHGTKSKMTSDSEDFVESFNTKRYTRKTKSMSDGRSTSVNLNLKRRQRKHLESSSDSESPCDSIIPKKCNKKSEVISDSEDSSKNENLKHHGTKSKMTSDSEDFVESFNTKQHTRKTKSILDGKSTSENLNLKCRQRKHLESSSDSESLCDSITPKKHNKKSKVISDSEDSSKNVNLNHHGTKSNHPNSDGKDFTESFSLKHATRKPKSISGERSSSENLNFKHHQRQYRVGSVSEDSFKIKQGGKIKLRSDSKSSSQNLNLKKHRKEELLQGSESFKTVRTLRKRKNPDRIHFDRSKSKKNFRNLCNVNSYKEDSSEASATSDNESLFTADIDSDHSGSSCQKSPKKSIMNQMLKKGSTDEKGKAIRETLRCTKTVKISDNESASETESVKNGLMSQNVSASCQGSNNKIFLNELQKKSPNKKENKNVAIEDEHSGSCIESLIGESYVSDSSDTNCSFKTITGEKYVVKCCAKNVMKLNVTVNLKHKGDPNKSDTTYKSNSFELSKTCRFGCNSKPFCCLKMHKITKIVNESIIDKENEKSVIKNSDDENSNTKLKPVKLALEISTRKNVDRNCVKCLAKFSNQKGEYDHICNKKPQKGFLCEYCEKFYTFYQDMQNHLRIHHKNLDKNHNDNSGKSDKNSSISLKENLKESGSAISITSTYERNCVQCFTKFSNNNEEYNHLCRGKKDKGFLCEYCEKLFPSFRVVLKHIRLIHRK